MRTKISLTIDRGIVRRLEHEAHEGNKSLSRHVEDILMGAGYEKE